ncbi:MAG TPA: FAD synthase [Halobacteriales archaeon]|nr:FAD synthase [Halobacteriales archaeon]
MKRVMAQGVFDVLHPGHIYYLSESAKLGDELHVVIARDSRIKQRKNIFMGENERREVIESMGMVSSAVLGSEGSLFDSVKKIKPNIITLGHDQEFDIDSLKEQLREAGFPDIDVVRVGNYEREGLQSSSMIKEHIQLQEGKEVFFSRKERRN